jgi:glutaredoxin
MLSVRGYIQSVKAGACQWVRTACATKETVMAQGPGCVVYCRSWCGDCHRAIKWLDDQGYEYDVVDIEEVPAARDRVVELAGKVITPTFEIGDACVVDFDPAALREALGEPPRG